MTKRESNLPLLAIELIRWRNEADMTQQELAVAVGATLNYIQKVERKGGEKTVRPSMDRLIMIATALDEKRLKRGFTAENQRIDTNYVLKLAGYPEIATPLPWALILQRITENPTNMLHTQEGRLQIAQQILDDYIEGSSNEKSGQQRQGDDTGRIEDGSEGAPEEGAEDKPRKPPHGGK